MEEEKGLNKLAKILTEPVKKLIDTVSAALGKWYEPIHKKRMAKAGAYEIDEVSEALRRNADVIAVYNNTEVRAQLPEDMQQLIERAQLRNISQEIKKQDNIEKVVDKASEFLEAETEVSEEPVDTDWITRFFNCAGEVSNEKMQTIWAHILAGEVKKPGSFSLRTLETVRNISRKEAEIFQKVLRLVAYDNRKTNYFISSDLELLKKYEISYDDIILMQDCRLINYSEHLSNDLSIKSTNGLICNNKQGLLFSCGYGKEFTLSVNSFNLTTAGVELFNMLNIEPDDGYLSDLGEILFKKYEYDNLVIRLCNYKYIDNRMVLEVASKTWGIKKR